MCKALLCVRASKIITAMLFHSHRLRCYCERLVWPWIESLGASAISSVVKFCREKPHQNEKKNKQKNTSQEKEAQLSGGSQSQACVHLIIRSSRERRKALFCSHKCAASQCAEIGNKNNTPSQGLHVAKEKRNTSLFFPAERMIGVRDVTHTVWKLKWKNQNGLMKPWMSMMCPAPCAALRPGLTHISS